MEENKKELYNDDIIWDGDNYNGSYPWKGAILAVGISFIILFLFIIPWFIGLFNFYSWVLKLLS